MRLISAFVFIVALAFGLSSCLPSKEEKEAAKRPPTPTIVHYSPTDAFTTASKVTAVEGMPGMWSVVVERESDKQWILAAVFPQHEMPIGTTVKICRSYWQQTAAQSMGARFSLPFVCH